MVSIGIGIVACSLAVRVAWVATVDAADYGARGAERRSFTRELSAPRGSIIDRDGETLVMSVPSDLVAVDPAQIEDADTAATTLAAELDLDRRTIREAMTTRGRNYVEIARDLTPDAGDRIRDLGLAGVMVDRRPKRERIGGDLATSIVGRMDSYGTDALSGLEKLYDEELTPSAGEVQAERDADNEVIPGTERVTRSARAGSDIWLTIDRPLQYVAEQVLMDQVRQVGARNATVVVGRTKTSEILAMASATRTDDGAVVADSLNQALREYEPGSVMKMATVSAAFDMGLVEPSTVVDVPGSITLGDYTISDHDPHGTVPMSVE